MSFIAAAIAVSTIGGAAIASRSASKATAAQVAGNQQDIAFQRESRDLARQDYAPYREAGYSALDALTSMTGLPSPIGSQRQPVGQRRGRGAAVRVGDYLRGLGGPKGRALGGNIGMRPNYIQQSGVGWGGPQRLQQYNVNENGPENVYQNGAVTRNRNPQTIEASSAGYVQPNENPGGVEGRYNFQTDPGYQFRLNEGMRALERGSAAAGGLLSGGFGRRAIRYGQDYASNEYANVYNRIANIAGLGQVGVQGSGNAALTTGAYMGNAASNMGAARASGYTAQGNAWGNAINNIAQLPWDQIWNKNSSGGGSYAGDGYGPPSPYS